MGAGLFWCRSILRAKFHSPFLAADYAGWLSQERGDTYTITVHDTDGTRLISLVNRNATYLTGYSFRNNESYYFSRAGGPPCDEQRIARITGQLTALFAELHERTTR